MLLIDQTQILWNVVSVMCELSLRPAWGQSGCRAQINLNCIILLVCGKHHTPQTKRMLFFAMQRFKKFKLNWNYIRLFKTACRSDFTRTWCLYYTIEQSTFLLIRMQHAIILPPHTFTIPPSLYCNAHLQFSYTTPTTQYETGVTFEYKGCYI